MANKLLTEGVSDNMYHHEMFSFGAERLRGNVDLFPNPMWSGARMPSAAEAGRVLGEAGEGAHSADTKAGPRGALQVHRTARGIR